MTIKSSWEWLTVFRRFSHSSWQNLSSSPRFDGEHRCTAIFMSRDALLGSGLDFSWTWVFQENCSALIWESFEVLFDELPAGPHVPFSEEWLPTRHTIIKAWLVKCCTDGYASLRLSVVPNLFHLRIMEATVLLDTFNAAEMFLYPSPDLSCCSLVS